MAGQALKYLYSLRIIEVEGRCPAWGSGGASKYAEEIQKAAKKEFDAPYDHAPDVDNAEKLIFDSLKRVAISDDRLIVETKTKTHDTSQVMQFDDEPIFLIDLLMKGVLAYTVIRIYEK